MASRSSVYSVDSQARSSIFESVEAKIGAAGLDEEVLELWAEIRATFEEDGPGAVKDLIEARVKKLQNAAKADLKTTRSVATVAAPKKKATATKKVAPAKRRAGS